MNIERLRQLLKDHTIGNELIAVVELAQKEVEAVEKWEDAIQKIIGRKPEAGLFTKLLRSSLSALDVAIDAEGGR